MSHIDKLLLTYCLSVTTVPPSLDQMSTYLNRIRTNIDCQHGDGISEWPGHI